MTKWARGVYIVGEPHVSSTKPTRYLVSGVRLPWRLWRTRAPGRVERWDGGAWLPALVADDACRGVPEEVARRLFPAAFATTGLEFARGRAFAAWLRASHGLPPADAWAEAELGRAGALDGLALASREARATTRLADEARATADEWIGRVHRAQQRWVDASAQMPERVTYVDAIDAEEVRVELDFGPDSVETYLDDAEARTAEAFGAWRGASRAMPEFRAYRRAQKRAASDEGTRFDAWQEASAGMAEFNAWRESWQDRAEKILAEQAWERASTGMPEYEAYRRAARALARADKAVSRADARADAADAREVEARTRLADVSAACDRSRTAWETSSHDLPAFTRWRDGTALDLSRQDLTGWTFVADVLSGADLTSANLEGVDLSRADLDGATLAEVSARGAVLAAASLASACLDGIDLESADLSGADLTAASLRQARLGGATLDRAGATGASFGNADMNGASLNGADLNGSILARARLEFATLVGARLAGADLRWVRGAGADLTRAGVCDARLGRADMRDATLESADLTNVRARRVTLIGAAMTGCVAHAADLRDGRLDRTVLRGATLSNADLRRASLRGADLRRADLRGATLRGADLRRAKVGGARGLRKARRRRAPAAAWRGVSGDHWIF